jgi:hypothetical protein
MTYRGLLARKSSTFSHSQRSFLPWRGGLPCTSSYIVVSSDRLRGPNLCWALFSSSPSIHPAPSHLISSAFPPWLLCPLTWQFLPFFQLSSSFFPVDSLCSRQLERLAIIPWLLPFFFLFCCTSLLHTAAFISLLLVSYRTVPYEFRISSNTYPRTRTRTWACYLYWWIHRPTKP